MTDRQAKKFTRKRLNARDKRIMKAVHKLVTNEKGEYTHVMFTRSWEVIGQFFDVLHGHLKKIGISKPGFLVLTGHPQGEPFNIQLNEVKLSEIHSEFLLSRHQRLQALQKV